MRRSRAALTLYLGALAIALQSAGLTNVQRGMAIEPPPTRLVAAPSSPETCTLQPPESLGANWYLDTCHPAYVYGAHGADCFEGAPVCPDPAWEDAQPIEEYEYGYQWDCQLESPVEAAAADLHIHLEDISHLAADPRHSTGLDEVMAINRASEGLQAASLSTGLHPYDLPPGENFPAVQVAGSQISNGFDYDDIDHGNADYTYCDCYGWDGEYACNEPDDLPPAEMELHVAEAPRSPTEYDYGDEYGYLYDDYVEPYTANAARAAEPRFAAGSPYEPADLPPGEHYSGDLPDAEPNFDDLPPAEEFQAHAPADEAIDDLPPAETPKAALPRAAVRNSYEYEYGYEDCYNCEYDPASYGDYPVVADYDAAEARAESLRPLLRSASWILSRMGEALLVLSKSCDEMADASTSEALEATRVPPELDYPWPTIIGRQPNRDTSPGL